MKVAVIGAGSWGTALAQLLGASGKQVVLWARRPEVAEEIDENKNNPRYLTDVKLSENIGATSDIGCALEGADAAVFVVPSAHLRDTAHLAAPYIPEDMPLIICSKGTEQDSGKLMSEVLFDEVGNNSRIAVLSGPTHAEEVVKGISSGAVCASSSLQTAEYFRDLFATNVFRTYTSTDIVGVELCAAFKNVIAIAVGISYGIGNGDNTAAMLITRGLAEMSRMVVACGGDAITCMGLAGAGDMVVTCMSRHSRNRRFGQDYVSKGKSLADFEADTHMVVEGAIASKTLEALSKRYDVDLPITDAVRKIVWEGVDPAEAAHVLNDRPLKEEFYGI